MGRLPDLATSGGFENNPVAGGVGMFRLEDLTYLSAPRRWAVSAMRREVGQQPAQVSAAIKRLETTLNIRLFARSTRSLRLTPEGETWLPYATQMLDTLQAGLQKIQTPDDEVRGTLQIAVPSDLGRNLLLNVSRLSPAAPGAEAAHSLSDHRTDVFKDPVDVAFRYGDNDDASFICCPWRRKTGGCWWLLRSGLPGTASRRRRRRWRTQCADCTCCAAGSSIAGP
jgi:DNA-binding transcriptional LysR family regulator